MSKHESFPSPHNTTPEKAEKVDLQFTDPEIPEALQSPQPESVPSIEVDYTEQRAEWREAKQSYTEAKRTYETRLAEYYDQYSEKNVASRAVHKLGEWWRGKPTELQALEADFKAKRAIYAEGLESVLSLRGQAQEQNHTFDATDIRTRTAFADRFIRQPRQDQLHIEKEHLHSPETVKQAERVLQILKKHKWTARIGMVAATGLIVGTGAGVAAGLAAGGIKAGRIALGVTGGIVGAAAGNWLGSDRVTKAETRLAEVQADTLASFTIQDIDTLENALTDAENTRDNALRARKHKIIAGALIGGGSLANLDSLADMIASPAAAAVNPEAIIFNESTPAPEAGDLLDQTAVDEIIHEARENSPYSQILEDEPAQTPTAVEPTLNTPETITPPTNTEEVEQLAADTLAVLQETASDTPETADATQNSPVELAENPAAEQLAADTLAVLQETAPASDPESVTPATIETVREVIPISDYNIERGDNLWKITQEVYAQQLEGLTETQQNQVLDGVFDRLRANPELTAALGVKSGSIDLVYQDDVLKMSVLSELITEEVERLTAPTPEGMTVVKAGDNLWNLTKAAYGNELGGLTMTQQNQVLDGVFDRLRANPELTAELGVQSGSIDLIRPGEQLNLQLLSELIEDKIGQYNGEPTVTETTADTSGAIPREPAPIATETSPAAPPPETAAPQEPLIQQQSIERSNTPPPLPHMDTPPAPTTAVENLVADTPAAPDETEVTPDPAQTASEQTPERALETTLTLTSPEVSIASEALRVPLEQSLRILTEFGSIEAFTEAKFDAIESLIGEQPRSWLNSERFEPVYQRIQSVSMAFLEANNLHTVEQLPDQSIAALLQQLRLDQSETNAHALSAWHAFYISQISPEHPDYLGIELRPTTTFNELFSEFVLQTSRQD